MTASHRRTSSPPPDSTAQSLSGNTMQLRMSDALARRKTIEGSYSKLEKAIYECVQADAGGSNKKDGVRGVDRRKLKLIVKSDPKLVLSMSELRALDLYLERFGDGLAYNPLFKKPEVLRSIAESGRVAFFLGSKDDSHESFQVNIAHLDFLGLSAIQRGLTGFSNHVHVDIREVRMHDDVDAAREGLKDAETLRLFQSGGPSLVSLGSSRGNQISNWMLCFMAGYKDPLVDAPSIRSPELPFQFVWPSKGNYVLESPFHIYASDIKSENPEVASEILEQEASGFRVSGEYLIDDLSMKGNSEGATYAVCAAQRRPGGVIWLLVAGLTGPATYAAAKWVNKMATGLDDYQSRGRSPVFWTILKADWRKVPKGKREEIEIDEASVLYSDSAWDKAPVIPEPDE